MNTRMVLNCLAVAALVIASACSTQSTSPPETADPLPQRAADESRDEPDKAPAAEAEAGALAETEPVAPSARPNVGSPNAASAAGSAREHKRKSDLAARHKSQALVDHDVYAAESAQSSQASMYCCMPPPSQEQNTEKYQHLEPGSVIRVAENPVSTFSIDVDTGSYSNIRRFLKEGRLPPQDAVRVEEMINYFDYAYAPPRDRGSPFSVLTEMAPTPWNPQTQLLQIGIQGWKPQGPATASNLVFLVDVSGSMQDANKLPLVKSSLKLLARKLRHDDRVSLVVYAGSSGMVLAPTPGDELATITSALDRLEAGGSTNGAGGIQLAYDLAQQAFIKGGNNRVMLATDGDFNVGITDFEQLIDLVEEKRKSGIALTTLGFGGGNYNDQLMERLADAGNGNHAYIDTLAEANKVLVEQRDATLTTIARDVKIQVEFNPAVVREYRLIGYENRALRREDFNNDHVDAGEIGAGHTVTALYEVALAGSGGERVDPLRYGTDKRAQLVDTSASTRELAFLRLRYKKPSEGMDAASQLIERPIRSDSMVASLAKASQPFRLAASVAAFGQLLRNGAYVGAFTYTEVGRLVQAARGTDANGYAGELLQLVKLADSLSTKQARVELPNTED